MSFLIRILLGLLVAVSPKSGLSGPCEDVAQQFVIHTHARDLPRGALELGGFAVGVLPEEISAINRQFGGAIILNGHISSVYAAASYQQGFYRKAAAVIRGIAKNHLFDNGNKRTAASVYALLRLRNGITTGVGPIEVRRVIDRVVSSELVDINDIATALRGF